MSEAIEQGLPLEEFSLSEIQTHAPAADEHVFVDLTVDAALGKRTSIGGTAPDQVAIRIARLQSSGRKSRPTASIEVRTARVSDLTDIKRLVDLWADAGENLPRSEEEILQSIGEFAVATENGRIAYYSHGMREPSNGPALVAFIRSQIASFRHAERKSTR